MKTLLALAVLAASTASSTFATAPAVPATTQAAPAPIPAKIVAPTGLPPQFAGKVIKIEFKLDSAGEPRDISVLDSNDVVLRRQLVAAFSQWRFTPVTAGSTDRRFILPLQLLPEA